VHQAHRILAEELLYSRIWTSEAQRAAAIKIWNVHYNYIALTPPPATDPGLTPPRRRHQRHDPEQLDECAVADRERQLLDDVLAGWRTRRSCPTPKALACSGTTR